MTTLTHPQEPAVADPAAPEQPVVVAPAEGDAPLVAAVERPCATCGAAMADGQDWCLECGNAAPGRLGRRPGWRAVGTTLALTVVLVAGAGAASYAALNSDATRQAATGPTADGTPVAQVPPVVAAPPAPVITPPPVKVPKVAAPVTPSTALPVAPTVVAPPSTPVTPTPTVTPTTPKSTTSAPRSTDTAAGSRGPGTAAEGSKPTSTAPLSAMTIDAGAAQLYDPYARAQQPGDPAAAIDGDPKTAFAVGAPADGKDMQVGLVVDLGSRKQVRGLKAVLSDAGATYEVYATDSPTLPSDILDTRWDHVASRKGAKASERIAFPKGGAQYRFVTLWFTKAPSSGPKVAVQDLQLLH